MSQHPSLSRTLLTLLRILLLGVGLGVAVWIVYLAFPIVVG